MPPCQEIRTKRCSVGETASGPASLASYPCSNTEARGAFSRDGTALSSSVARLRSQGTYYGKYNARVDIVVLFPAMRISGEREENIGGHRLCRAKYNKKRRAKR